MYLLAEHTVEATTYAAQVLGVPIRRQAAEIVCITEAHQLPSRFGAGDLIRATPMFWESWRAREEQVRAANDSWGTPGQRQRRLANVSEVSAIATTVRMRGGTILPPYDTPDAMDRESVEAWLAED